MRLSGFVSENWRPRLEHLAAAIRKHLLIICPLVHEDVLRRLLARFNLNDFATGVSQIGALEHILDRGSQIKGTGRLRLSDTAATEIAARFQAALDTVGQIGNDRLNQLTWPGPRGGLPACPMPVPGKTESERP